MPFAHETAVENLLDRNWSGSAGVNDTFIVLDRDEDVSFIKYGPVFLNECRDANLSGMVQVRDIEFRHNDLCMEHIVVLQVEERTNR